MDKKNTWMTAALLILLATVHSGMARHGQYDEEARELERQEKLARKSEKQGRRNPFKQFGKGVKEATVDSTAGLVSETAESTREDAPVLGTLEGARQGTGKVLDKTVRGGSKIATLGYGGVENYEVEQPKSGTNDTTKIKIKIPGT